MIIGGFERYSFIDFPGRISSVIFTQGCNFHCPYCHNPELVRPVTPLPAGGYSETEIFAFLEKRKKYIDGVAITGGEPTLQADLQSFCRRLKDIGLLVKLDTNGSAPKILASFIHEGLVDYIAMDIKTDPDRYPEFICDSVRPDRIRESIRTICSSGLPHEFRTTCVKPLVDEAMFFKIAGLVQGASLYALQLPHFEKVLDPSFFTDHEWHVSGEEMDRYCSILSSSVKRCVIR